MLSLYIANILVVLLFSIYGKIINAILFVKTKRKIFELIDILTGIIFLSFGALVINFFFPLNYLNNNIILFFGVILYFFLNAKFINTNKIFKYSLIIGSMSFLIMTLDISNRPDAGLYHLPYISIINDHKIIFGLSNIHFRFGHTSIIQYTSAIFNNSLFNEKGITVVISVILSTFFLYFYECFKKSKSNYFFLILYFLISSFFVLKMSRYNDIGNDTISHASFFLAITYFLNYALKKNILYRNFFFLSLISIFTFTNKIFLIFVILFPIFLIIIKKKYDFILYKRNLLLIFLILTFFIKNFIITSCIVYPIKFSCFNSLSWSSVDKKTHSDPEIRSLASKVHAKAWADYSSKNLTFEEYNKNFNWLETWLEKHFKYLFKKLIVLFFLLAIVILIILLNEEKLLKYKKKETVFSKIIKFAIGTTFFASVYWFLNFPLYRYGYSLFISCIIITFSYYVYLNFSNFNYKRVKKYFSNFLILFFILISLKNLIRIIENYDLKYKDFPWPKIYSYDENNKKQKNIEILNFDKLKIKNPQYRLCMYSDGLCTNFRDIKDQIIISKKLNYFFINLK